MAGDNRRQKELLAELPKITAELNARAKAQGKDFQFTQQELATNFISEGGSELLGGSPPSPPYDGYDYLGIDTMRDNYATVKPWLTDDLQKRVQGGKHGVSQVNEQGKNVHTITVDSVGQGLRANAAMFARARSMASAEATKEGKKFSEMTDEERFYYTTMYYNTSPGTAAAYMKAQDGHVPKWKGKDSEENSMDARYNAAWRTATFDYLNQTTSTEPEKQPEPEKK
jgi:hypothetical protein